MMKDKLGRTAIAFDSNGSWASVCAFNDRLNAEAINTETNRMGLMKVYFIVVLSHDVS